MQVMPTPAEVRRLVADLFSGYLDETLGPLDLNETIRVDAGKLVARTYSTDELWAMWMIEIGLLQLYDCEGRMLQSVNLLEELAPVRAAA